MNLIEKVFGTHSDRELKLIYPIVDKIVALKPGDGEADRRGAAGQHKKV